MVSTVCADALRAATYQPAERSGGGRPSTGCRAREVLGAEHVKVILLPHDPPDPGTHLCLCEGNVLAKTAADL
jgi:hypothetical protein